MLRTTRAIFPTLMLILGAGCATTRSGEPNAPARNTIAAAIVEPTEADPARSPDGPDRSAARPEPESVPTACATEGTPKTGKVCMVGAAYTKKLCAGIYPEVALELFAKGTPFTRAYLRGDVDAWNASGGLTHRAQLAFDEEVLVLAKHDAGGGIVMTGSQASYDVLRWDGTCVSITQGEMTMQRPPSPKPSPISWTRLDESARRALLESPKVKSSQGAIDEACTSGDAKACDRATTALSRAIAEYVRGGGSIPAPPRRP